MGQDTVKIKYGQKKTNKKKRKKENRTSGEFEPYNP